MSEPSRAVVATPEDSILKGFLSLSGGVLAARVVAFVGTTYLARTLGSYGFGIVGFAIAITTFVGIGLRNGFEPVGAREVARDTSLASSLAVSVALLRSLFAVLGVLILCTVAFLLQKPSEVKLVVALWSLNLLPLALDPRWVYRGLGRNRWVGISMVLAQVIYVGCLLVTVRGPDDLGWVPLALLLGELVAVSYLAVPLMRGWDWRPDFARAWQVAKASGFLVASGLLGAVMRSADVVMIAFLLNESAVGLYSAAYRLSFLVMAIAIALQSAYLPRLARAARDSLHTTGETTRRAFEFAAVLAIPIVVGGWQLSEPLMTHLFGGEFGAAKGALQYLLLAMGLFFFNGVLLQLTVAFDRTRRELVIRSLAAATNIGLNLWWIPRFGISGAALATFAAELLMLVLRLLLCRSLGIRTGIGFLMKPLLAAAGMAGVILAIQSRWQVWWLWLLVGALVYGVLLAVLRGIPRDVRG